MPDRELGRPIACSILEFHHLPDRGSVVQPVEALVDLAQRQYPGHQPVDRQPAAPIELDEARNIPAGYGRADIAALECSLLRAVLLTTASRRLRKMRMIENSLHREGP